MTAQVSSAAIAVSVTGATIVTVRVVIVRVVVVTVIVISVRVTPAPPSRKAEVTYEDDIIRESMIVTTPIAAPAAPVPVSSPP